MIQSIQNEGVRCDIVTHVGHIAPVHFKIDDSGTTVQPYSIPPWSPDESDIDIPAVRWLRGDFFGFPFGVNECHPHVHGPAANGPWKITDQTHASLSLAVPINGEAILKKRISLKPNHRILYNEHTFLGLSGAFNYGHHPVLYVPKHESVEIRTSPFKFAQVYPQEFGKQENGERCIFRPGAHFDSLSKIPLKTGNTLSLAQYPTPESHEDLVMLSADRKSALGWTAVSYPRYVWISLRSTQQFPSTLFWVSNGGRSQTPWNGAHDRRLGIEDVCSYFHEGREQSSSDPLKDQNIATCRIFSAETPTVLRHAQGVHPTPSPSPVAAITPIDGQDAVQIQFEDGSQTEMPLAWRWLTENDLP